MDKASVDRWLERYIEAWRSYDEALVHDLFTEDAEYRWHPYDEKPAVGREAIYKGWVDPQAKDDPGTYEASYKTVAVDGDVAVATGTSTYYDEPGGKVDRIYHNCFVMAFDGDRCKSFTEYYIKQPS